MYSIVYIYYITIFVFCICDGAHDCVSNEAQAMLTRSLYLMSATIFQCMARAVTQAMMCVAVSSFIRSRLNFLPVCQLVDQILWRRGISGHLENSDGPVSRLAGYPSR